ncbi:DNA alkylation repair protein [Paenibacillus thermoaerophilus]|uniref:DNA alkylation repair protein n=1 Tax=Paenibacillus thermoaerophilus TaxID=1215385 RepID=A0ABW2V5V6_9BACL|nr:DNA alkylation repair protein [Paenibacillus thermoaerophilus]TMV13926.1 DNA alkylation repair protein [Paenibacillus thermoaerophilus]
MADKLKDRLNREFLENFASVARSVRADFPEERFVSLALDGDWERLELKQRFSRLAEVLRETLPGDYREALDVLNRLAPVCSGFEYLFFPAFVERYGLDDWEASLPALEWLTRFSSAEFAVRPFIVRDTERMMAQMLRWAEHENEHVRRLASEGCRPRLPWAMALNGLKRDPSPVLPILERLKRDPSLYVRRSVANNLNDIAKDHPELVKELAVRWSGQHPDTDWILRHGCRTLFRHGDEEALSLFGYESADDVRVSRLRLSAEEARIGGSLTFECEIANGSDKPQKLRVAYGIDFVKSGGKLSRKWFKLADKPFAPGATVLSRSHSFRNLSTRKHYPGPHRLVIAVNGDEKAAAEFLLRE